MDSGGRSLLFCACANNRPDCVHLLLELDAERALLDYPDGRGDAPLHAAACNGHLDCVQALLDGNADHSAVNSQQLTPAALAFGNQHLECHELLVSYGAEPAEKSGSAKAAGAADGHPNRDYKQLAADYARQAAHRVVEGMDAPTCVICKKRQVKDMFFPCEHACVCPKCISKNNIGPAALAESSPAVTPGQPPVWSACPLCMEVIQSVTTIAKGITLPRDYGPNVLPPPGFKLAMPPG